MFERFTEQARQVIVLAQEEARGLRHGYIGTEHLLLGLCRAEDGVASVLGPLAGYGRARPRGGRAGREQGRLEEASCAVCVRIRRGLKQVAALRAAKARPWHERDRSWEPWQCPRRVVRVPRARAGGTGQAGGTARRRFSLILAAGAVLITVVATLHGVFANTDSFPTPSRASVAGLSLRQRIVVIAGSQVGYSAEPSTPTATNSAPTGTPAVPTCPSGERTEEWCADFAAWAWQRPEWSSRTVTARRDQRRGRQLLRVGLANGAWHPATRGYVASPGDVAVYGLSLGTGPSAAHVAIVTDDTAGQLGPDVINGDGNRTGFSVVEGATDQLRVHADHKDATLAGYVAHPSPSSSSLFGLIRGGPVFIDIHGVGVLARVNTFISRVRLRWSRTGKCQVYVIAELKNMNSRISV